MLKGDAQYSSVDSLSAFWPGLQVLGGDIENAIKTHLVCMSQILFSMFGSLIISQIGTFGEVLLAFRKCGI